MIALEPGIPYVHKEPRAVTGSVRWTWLCSWVQAVFLNSGHGTGMLRETSLDERGEGRERWELWLSTARSMHYGTDDPPVPFEELVTLYRAFGRQGDELAIWAEVNPRACLELLDEVFLFEAELADAA